MNSSTEHETKSIFNADKKLLFVLLCIASLLLLIIKKSFIENKTAAFEFLLDRPEGTLLQFISALQFAAIPILYLWKFTVISFALWVSCFLFGYRITYSQCWHVALVSEFIFIIPELLKILWFLFIFKDPTLHDLRAFYPFSLMHFFDYYELEKRYAYPLRALNAFEILYWWGLASGIHHFARKQLKTAGWIVSGYVLLFLLWLAFYVVVYK